jgi:hypothetical protein
MKDYGQSRAEKFLVKNHRRHPMAQARFEISEYRSCKVHPDCLFQVEKNFYSVAFLVGGTAGRAENRLDWRRHSAAIMRRPQRTGNN